MREHLGADKHIKQMHSSSDDRVHSATVQDSSWRMTGCVAYLEDSRRAVYVAAKGDYDECQIDKSGRWLVIKEDVDGRDGEDNRIIDLQSGGEQVFLDRDGAAGHSDLGYGYLVAEDNMYSTPGAARVWQFGQDMRAAGQGTLVYNLTNWDASAGLGHISHENALPGVPIAQQMACTQQCGASESAARERDCLFSSRRVEGRAHCGAEHDRLERRRGWPRRLLEAPEGQPRSDRRILHLDDQSRHQPRTTPSSSGFR